MSEYNFKLLHRKGQRRLYLTKVERGRGPLPEVYKITWRNSIGKFVVYRRTRQRSWKWSHLELILRPSYFASKWEVECEMRPDEFLDWLKRAVEDYFQAFIELAFKGVAK